MNNSQTSNNNDKPNPPEPDSKPLPDHQKQKQNATTTKTQARTHVYNYYKQVSRRRHQYGDPQAMSFIPLTPLDHTGAISAYKAGVDAIASDSRASLDDVSQDFQARTGSGGKSKQHQLPPLATNASSASGGGKERGSLESRDSSGAGREPQDDDDLSKALGDDDRQHYVGVRVSFLTRISVFFFHNSSLVGLFERQPSQS